MNDDDWELFVPVKGEMYPNQYQVKLHDSSDWQDGGSPGLTVKSPTCYAYRKPKQKENKVPDRTPQQALKDAIDSGAVDAWINEEEIQYSSGLGWFPWTDGEPEFLNEDMEWRPSPPEPTKINWRPVVTGKEQKGVVMGYWGPETAVTTIFKEGEWRNPKSITHIYNPPSHWAPMCNLPE